ncbi:hypothetical protein [Vibrio anguillarum]|uniref:hypothetical protein n=1 Tax=Vibrio anguillarum TaxID=55601 RepID=UPI0009806B3D|nr:hypothetical protein [Vibrio anguillarum]AQP38041.1 hypothetical protein AA909_16980 [Vibrio anguillarum]
MNPMSEVFPGSLSGYSDTGGFFLFLIVVAFFVMALESGVRNTLGAFGKGLVFISKMYAFCAGILFLMMLWNYALVSVGFPRSAAVTGISMLVGLINALWLLNIWEKRQPDKKE